MSTATSSNSHCAVPGEGRTASAPSTMVVSSAGLAGLQMRVATRDMQANSLGLSKAVLIAGPTASGKSALALELAQKTGGIVINTDSMQVYRDLRIITARPTVEEEARAPHRLYGHVDASVNFSAGAWVADAGKVLAEARAAKTPADLHRRFRPVLQGVDARPLRGAADPGRDTRRRSRAAGTRRRRSAACRAGAARSRLGRTPEAARPHPDCPRAGGRRSHRPCAARLASRRPAAAAAAGRIHRAVPRARARSALCADRCAVRRDAGRGRAGGGRRAGRAKARSAAAGDEGPWRAGADPPSRAARSRANRPPKSAAPTPAITPSGSSPGSGTSCRSSNGWRRRRRGGGWRPSFRSPDGANAQSGIAQCAPAPGLSLRSIRNDDGCPAWLNRKFPLAERPEHRYTAKIALMASFP